MKMRICILVVLISAFIFLVYPYAKAEYLTLRFGDDFAEQEQQTHMLDPADFHKVIEYSDTRAVVLYVSSTSKNEITFVKDSNGLWKIDVWKTIWSKTGSADEFYWPYYAAN